jgi:hypothetical protein
LFGQKHSVKNQRSGLYAGERKERLSGCLSAPSRKRIGRIKAIFAAVAEYRRAKFEVGWATRARNSAEFPDLKQEVDPFSEFFQEVAMLWAKLCRWD